MVCQPILVFCFVPKLNKIRVIVNWPPPSQWPPSLLTGCFEKKCQQFPPKLFFHVSLITLQIQTKMNRHQSLRSSLRIASVILDCMQQKMILCLTIHTKQIYLLKKNYFKPFIYVIRRDWDTMSSGIWILFWLITLIAWECGQNWGGKPNWLINKKS